jgi:anti-sigma factor RsiW
MEREKLESLLIDYIDGRMEDKDRETIEQELVTNPESFTLYEQFREVIRAMDESTQLEPSSKLRNKFDQLIREESAAPLKARTIWFHPVFQRIAAAVTLVILGGGIGFWISRQQKHDAELLAMQTEMKATKMMLMTMLENQQSASQRVLGATVAFNDVEIVDDEIVDALVHAMNEDPNTNVRVAALEALGKFHDQLHVRKALIASLNVQDDPLVQIALIRLMVEMKEKSVVQDLERITTDDNALPAVKDEAHAGLLKLS